MNIEIMLQGLGLVALLCIIIVLLLIIYFRFIEKYAIRIWHLKKVKGWKWRLFERRKVEKMFSGYTVEWQLDTAENNAKVLFPHYPDFVKTEFYELLNKRKGELNNT